jgi:RNA polymerase sigma-70 factor (ECF subfamily)
MNTDSYILKEGGEKGFEVVFKKYSRFVFNTAYEILQDVHLANDIVQEVFCMIWADKNKIKAEVSLGGQLWHIARNKAIDVIRHRSYDILHEDFKNFRLVDTSYIDIINDAELYKLVKRLPLRCRSIFILKYQFGKSAVEISVATGLAIQTVRNRIHEGLSILRQQLKHA